MMMRVGFRFIHHLKSLAAANKPDVLLDVTDPDAVFKNVHDAITLGIRPVVGTSGLI